MKYLFTSILIVNLVFNSSAQKKAEFEMYFYFEDAIGKRDTLFFRADSSIIDDPTTTTDDLNVDWGESIDNSPFDTILTIRAKGGFNIGGNFYKNIIHKSYDEGNVQGYKVPVRLAIFVYTKHWPVRMSWNKAYFRNHDRLYGTYATTDFYMTQKYLFKDPFPYNRADIACLASEDMYERTLTIDALEKNKEIPYIAKHEVSSIGKVDLCAIMITFGRPFVGLCDTLTAVKDYKLEELKIYPTLVGNEITIENPLNHELVGEILSLEGKLVHNFNVRENVETIQMNELKSGLYFVKFTSKNRESKCFKILKE